MSSQAREQVAIRLRGIHKHFLIYARPRDRLLQSLWRGRRIFFHEHKALKPIDLDIMRGETMAIVGVNGSGKSTLLQLVCGTLQPTGGVCETHGRISALLELGAGFNPEFSGRENIILNATILGLTRREIDERYDGIVAFSGLDVAVLDRPVKTYSSGMYVRLAFAVAIAVEPDILIVDEALAVGDEAFQRKCFARIRALQEKGSTILFVSHSARTVTDLCSRAILLDQGEMLLQGTPKEVMEQYHRLIFAPVEQQPLIRQAILARGEGALPLNKEGTRIPESRVAYVSAGAEIIEPQLTDDEGHPLQVLTMGQTCRFSYRVRFSGFFRDVRFSMLIKSKTGMELVGSLCRAEHKELASVEEGSEVEVTFRFVNRLCDGSYFFNCGVLSRDVEEGDIFLHRIVDAVQFQVMPLLNATETAVTPTALIDFSPEVTLTLNARPTSRDVSSSAG